MSSNSNDENSESWETETPIAEFYEEIPTYSWENETLSPIYDNKPEGHVFNQVTDDVFGKEIEELEPSQLNSNTYGGCPVSESYSQYYDDDFAQRPESPNLNLDLDAIQRELCDDLTDTYGESSSKGCKDHYYDDDFAQRPESPDFNLDLDAIQRECEEDLYSLGKKLKGKKRF
ncbi:unnamed protein product [Cochlearia groenlandica]